MSENQAGQKRDAQALWQEFLHTVKEQISPHVLDTWLRPVRCREFSDGAVVLEVRDQFSRDWLCDHYLDFIRKGLSTVLNQEAGECEPVAIEWAINADIDAQIEAQIDIETPASPAVDAALPPLRAALDAATTSMPASAPRHSDSAPHDPMADIARLSRSHPSTSGPSPQGNGQRRLNPRYHFESFVCGPSNEFALAASKAVAEKPGTSYNPLFIFGGVGLGKTHLLGAIGHQVMKERPNLRVVYASAEEFTQEVINAVLGSKLQEFRARYGANCDVLMIDDIQLIAGKERTQHEFFHIFNLLYDSQKLIVVTSDKLPHEIPEIEERLRSRFQWGLIADIQPPEIETRVAILKKKAITEGLALPDDVAFYLAENIRSNVRELEGALVRVMAHSSLTGSEISVDYCKRVLADILAAKAHKLSVEGIQKLVADYFQVRISDLKSKRRNKILVRPRQVAMYLCRKHVGASYPELGSRFGNKDHTTVMSACKKIDKLLKADPAVRTQVTDLERDLDVRGS